MSEETFAKQIAKAIKVIRDLLSKYVNAQHEAESEVHEKMRRFAMYMHDMHDIKNLYVEHGVEVPTHISCELERCDDRLRQLLNEAHTDGGNFVMLRREIAKDTDNRWDHTRAIGAQK